ncbi:MAG: class I SAM-dependent methyltransferase [bacterium]|nr:class I SAM-dependent methyltransferase [bacterium]
MEPRMQPRDNHAIKMPYYDALSDGYNELHGEEQLKKLEIIKNKLKPKKTDKILDVGCGTGLSEILGNVTGIDPAEKLLKKAKIKTVKGAAEKLPFKDNSFDIVISVTAIHNFSDAEKAVKEMKRVSKGKIVISILKKSGNFSKIKKIIEKNLEIEDSVKEEKDEIFFCR